VQDLFAEIQECSAHSCPKLSDEKDCRASAPASASASEDEDEDDDEDDDADNLANDNGDGHKKLLCLHEECSGKLKTSFKTWKDLVRHYTIRISLLSAIHRIWRGLTNLIRRRSMSRSLWVLWNRHTPSAQIRNTLRQLQG
jgi:hypothetical protein